jgi:hypothetical protein
MTPFQTNSRIYMVKVYAQSMKEQAKHQEDSRQRHRSQPVPRRSYLQIGRSHQDALCDQGLSELCISRSKSAEHPDPEHGPVLAVEVALHWADSMKELLSI